MRLRFVSRAALVALALVAASAAASADPAAPAAPAAPASATAAPPSRGSAQGVAVLAVGAAHDEAFALARAVYGSSLRPRGLDEVRARVLAGDPAPAVASQETRELAELRGAITGEDAASRRLLGSIAQQLHVQAILVVRVERPAADAGAGPAATICTDTDAGTDAACPTEDAAAPPSPASTTALLFLADAGDFDAARYAPDASASGAAAWRSTVVSLERRFPSSAAPPSGALAAGRAAPTIGPEAPSQSKPFYTTAWFWGALGAALLVGGAFYFASRDTSDQPIHLQMHVPR